MSQFPPKTGSVSVDFTDGDSFKRVTVTDPNVDMASTITPSIRRANVAEPDDGGWIFVANVVNVVAATPTTLGSFDVNIAALVLGEPPLSAEGPNETVSLVFSIQ